MQYPDDSIFISFDCAYRTLGWCILEYKPSAALLAIRDGHPEEARSLFRVIAGGVEDVLGAQITDVKHAERARRLYDCLDRIIPREIIARAVVIIEHQPRQQSVRGLGTVRGDNQVIESQLVFYFSAIPNTRAKYVYLIDAKKKDVISSVLLHESIGKTYAERKKQSRRAYIALANVFDFSACMGKLAPYGDRELKRLKADQSDACLQIFAGIFICWKNILEQ